MEVKKKIKTRNQIMGQPLITIYYAHKLQSIFYCCRLFTLAEKAFENMQQNNKYLIEK